MNYVSEVGEVLMFRLIAWELLGREDFDPKALLRALSLADLDLLMKNIGERSDGYLSTQMVKVEMMYRLGRLKEDWRICRDGVQYTLEPMQFHSLSPRWVGANA